ncbi:MAG: His-Xaa-Ser system radical SAM maturase HxsC [Methylophilaceae bacterium]|nr:His-Xaa-Ser system radical SAM maturase HxsC [Methylophilaceae bacterium]
MKQIQAEIIGFKSRSILLVLSFSEISAFWNQNNDYLVKIKDAAELLGLQKLNKSGLTNLRCLIDNPSLIKNFQLDFPYVLTSQESPQDGDIVAINNGSNFIHILFRETDLHHTVFLTNRCNSNCIMCSQPPTKHDDSWLVDEAMKIAAHMRISPEILGFTGGEPLFLGVNLRQILDVFLTYHPNIKFDLLTNGRLISDSSLAEDLLGGMQKRITWMIPLYGHADFLHDFVVQSYGAFEQTVDGILTLHKYQQDIQIRIVLIKPVLENLSDLCNFIGKNFPFVKEVALIACEPTGFALANRVLCQTDLKDWSLQLEKGVDWLERQNVKPIIMNAPLCALSEKLWPYAQKSISDWKRVFDAECDKCDLKDSCCGLFFWYDKQWSPTKIVAFQRRVK